MLNIRIQAYELIDGTWGVEFEPPIINLNGVVNLFGWIELGKYFKSKEEVDRFINN